MLICRTFAKATGGKLEVHLDTLTITRTTVSPLTSQTSAVRGHPSTPTRTWGLRQCSWQYADVEQRQIYNNQHGDGQRWTMMNNRDDERWQTMTMTTTMMTTNDDKDNYKWLWQQMMMTNNNDEDERWRMTTMYDDNVWQWTTLTNNDNKQQWQQRRWTMRTNIVKYITINMGKGDNEQRQTTATMNNGDDDELRRQL